MALTKVNRGGLNTGVSDSSNATFLTATSAEGVTLAGTLAVTGVHTVGNNAIYTSDGGAVTQNTVQSLIKMWVHAHQEAVQDSFNIASSTDVGTGDFTFTATNILTSISACAFGSNQSSRVRFGHYINPISNGFNVQPSNSSSGSSDDNTSTALAGDLA